MKELVLSYYKEFRTFFQKPRVAIQQILNITCIILAGLMLWKALMIYTNNRSPIVVVLSGSMEPAFFRGDILFLIKTDQYIAGDIIVFQLDGREIPIVHRLLNLHENSNDDLKLLTKGDNNSVDDRGLYAEKQLWLERNHVVGTAVGFLPHVGIITIWLNDYPLIKWSVIGLMGLMVLTGNEI